MANTSNRIQSSLIPTLRSVIAMNNTAWEQALRRYTKYHMKTKKRNRFQLFFFKVHLKLERACSYIEQELIETRGRRDDFSNR